MKNYEHVLASSASGCPSSVHGNGSLTKSDSLVKSVSVENINITAYQVWIRGNFSLTPCPKPLLICHDHFIVGTIKLLLESKLHDLILSISCIQPKLHKGTFHAFKNISLLTSIVT